MNQAYTTTLECGVRVIAYQQETGLCKRVTKWHCAIPGAMSPGVNLSDALSSVVGYWDGKTMAGNWHGGELVELTNDQFAALDASCADGTRFWMSRFAA